MHPTPDSQQHPAVETTSLDQSVESVVSGLRALAGSSPPPEGGASPESRRQDQRAVIYDDLYEILQPCYRAYEDWVTEAVYSAWYEGRGRLLVVGCGTGTLIQRLVQRMPAKLITAVDLSPQMARRAREKVPAVPEIRTTAFDGYRPVVPFDVVVFNGSISAMPDLRDVAEHTASMTLHGSRIVICVRNGDWKWRNPPDERSARMRHPSWYWKRWINKARIAEVAALTSPVASPHPLLTAAKISEAFEGRFGLRDQRTDFGVTRLFESVIAAPREQALQTVGLTREHRPWMGSLARYRKLDEAFEKENPMGGGLLAMMFDKLH